MPLFLHLIRHAQAEEAGQYTDFYRPLTQKGMMDSARIANKFAESKPAVDLIICSDAERTIRTAEIYADFLKMDSEATQKVNTLYNGRLQEYMDCINQIDNACQGVLLVGHNPFISYVAEYLTGENFGEVPTSGLISIRFELDQWPLISKKTGSSILYQTPNDFNYF
jgi:phosphohistidine phosphatase